MEKEPRYNETLLWRTYFATPLVFRYIEVHCMNFLYWLQLHIILYADLRILVLH